jgi:lipoprotein NlpD
MKSRYALAIGVLAAAAAGCASQQGGAPVVDRSAASGRPQPPAVAKVTAPTPRVLSEDYYEVRRGDTLYSIALEHGVDYRELAQWNGLDDPTRIRAGQVLRVKPDPAHSVTLAPTRGAGAIEARPLDSPPPGSAATGVAKPAPAAASAPSAAMESQLLKFIWPAKGKVIAAFEQTHGKGLDIEGRVGDPVLAAARGKVTYVGSGIRGMGKMLIIQHNREFLTVYAHTSQIVVKESQVVEAGQKIAEIGSSDSDRPLLHFQIRKLGRPLDPAQFLPRL